MFKDLNGQVAVITGGGSGIGRYICLEFAKNGAKVIVTGRRESNIEETKKIIEEQGGYAETYKMDVSCKEDVEKVFEQVFNKHGKIDILINNAGFSTPQVFCTEMTDEAWDGLLKTHLYGTFYTTRACAKYMKKNKYGRIVNMSSIAGVHGLTGNINYATAKTGFVGFTNTLAKELGPYGITVNALQPGVIRTAMTEGPLSILEEQFVKETPVRRIGEPSDIAKAALFFCSPDSDFVTGVIMKVDGGYILNSGMDMVMFEMCENQN